MDARIRLRDDIATFWRDHNALAKLGTVGILNGLEHTSWNTSSALDAGPVIVFTIVICWAVLYPMTLPRCKSGKLKRYA